MLRVLPLLLLAVLAARAPASARDLLDDDAVERHLAALRPSAAELAWRRIPWRSTLWRAVVDAHREKKPILLWAMNGHPLGCT